MGRPQDHRPLPRLLPFQRVGCYRRPRIWNAAARRPQKAIRSVVEAKNKEHYKRRGCFHAFSTRDLERRYSLSRTRTHAESCKKVVINGHSGGGGFSPTADEKHRRTNWWWRGALSAQGFTDSTASRRYLGVVSERLLSFNMVRQQPSLPQLVQLRSTHHTTAQHNTTRQSLQYRLARSSSTSNPIDLGIFQTGSRSQLSEPTSPKHARTATEKKKKKRCG